VQNQAETGVDCGGTCTACPTCSDGVQNQAETGVDCGGPCTACRERYVFPDRTALKTGVDLWISNRDSALTTYGHISTDWDTSQVTDMNRLFEKKPTFNDPIGAWDTSKVTNMDYMFRGGSDHVGVHGGPHYFNQPIGAWDTSKVTTMHGMFQANFAFNQPIGTWDTSKVTSMYAMFYQAHAFNQPIGAWDTSKVTTMYRMLQDATAFTTTRRTGGPPLVLNSEMGVLWAGLCAI
jgi:surface protein